MPESIVRDGVTYDPLFRTQFLDEKKSVYYLNRETGMCFRQADDSSANCVVLGMFPNEIRIIHGLRIIEYIKKNDGRFPFFVPRFGLNLEESFNIRWPYSDEREYHTGKVVKMGESIPTRLFYPCCLRFFNDRPFKLSDVVEGLEKNRIVLKKDVPDDLMLFYGSCVKEVYGEYNPLDYLNS